MLLLCVTLVSLGAMVMLYSIIRFYNALVELKKQMHERRLFGEKIYAACFVMMLFFLVGYLLFAFVTLREATADANSLLIALVFFFGAVFVYAMISMIRRMFTSVTDRERLSREKEVAENASRMKGEFLSRMSHEMRTPMNAIVGMTYIGKNATDIKRKDYCLHVVEDASKHLLGVINDVLDISKIEANKLELSPQMFSVQRMLNTLSAIVIPQTDAKQQKLQIVVDDNVPVAICADEQRLRQVIVNLIGNAIKFTPESGTVSLFIRMLSKKNRTARLQFAVTDTGIGMSEEKRDKLFLPFEQVDSSISRKYGGTGLGLAISQQIVETMGSTIQVESKIGEGSRFLFTIDAEYLEAEDWAVAEQDETDSTAPLNHDFTGKKVLIAEDIEINREIIEVLLETTHIGIEFAEDGSIACDMFMAEPKRYDIIFMDLHMPEMDGYEASRRIRGYDDAWAQAVPIIAMTADVFKEDVEKCLKAGMNGHLGKPINIHEVIAVLNKYLFAQAPKTQQ